MNEVAGGILIAAGVLFIVLPILTIFNWLILAHILNAMTPKDIISDEASTICLVLGFISAIIIIYSFW